MGSVTIFKEPTTITLHGINYTWRANRTLGWRRLRTPGILAGLTEVRDSYEIGYFVRTVARAGYNSRYLFSGETTSSITAFTKVETFLHLLTEDAVLWGEETW